jgi:hypothetical protein
VVTEAVPTEALPAAPERHPAPGWRPTSATYLAVAAVLAWFAVQLAPFIGEAPDLDAMVSLRESIVLHREGLGGLIDASVGTGIHPPLLDTLAALMFTLFGEEPSSQQLLAIVMFVVVSASTERLLAPWLPTGQRVAAAFAVAICPSLAISLFLVSREGLTLAVLLPALVLALAPGKRRPLVLGAVLALLPLVKETGLVLVIPFALDALLRGGGPWGPRVRRAALVLGPAVLAALAWRGVLALAGGSAWHTWVVSDSADKGAYVVALRAMFGLEEGIYLRQNLANAFIVNYLWLPALLALVTLVLLVRRGIAPGQQRAVELIAGLALLYTWTALTFPTFTVPRYAAPLTLLTLLIVLVGLAAWPRRSRPFVLGALILAFLAGAWSPTDPVSRALFDTTSVGGERIYDTAERERGPDRMSINFAVLRATERLNGRLRRVFATDATLVTGDCNAMKLGEKLFSVGFTPSVYDRAMPGARPLRCVRVEELPAGVANGKETLVLVRTTEDEVTNVPLQVTGPAVKVVR